MLACASDTASVLSAGNPAGNGAARIAKTLGAALSTVVPAGSWVRHTEEGTSLRDAGSICEMESYESWSGTPAP